MGLELFRKRVLLIGSEGIVLYGPVAGGIEREIALAWESPDFDTLLTEALSKQHQKSSLLMLFDGADQTYRKESNIPKLTVFDKPRFIKRKLDQAFPSYPIRAAIEIRPPKDGKKKSTEPSSYFFVAIPETDRFDRIAGDALEAGTPISGLGLLPVESQELVSIIAGNLFKDKGEKSRWSVLVAQHEMGGLRQVVVKDGNLVITRMTPTSEAGIRGPEWAEEVMREIKATLTYIARFAYNPADGLDIVVICGDSERQYFEKKSLPVTNFQCTSPAECLAVIGMAKGDRFEDANFGDSVYTAWASKKRSLVTPITIPSIQRILIPRLGVKIATIVLTLALLGLSGFAYNDYSTYDTIKEEISSKQSQKTKLAQELDTRTKDLETLPVKSTLVKTVISTKALLENNSLNVPAILDTLHRSFAGSIKLSSLVIEHYTSASLKVGANAAPVRKNSDGTPVDDSRGTIKINFQFQFIEPLPLELKVKNAVKLTKTLQKNFPGSKVGISKQFGNVSSGGKFDGVAGKTQDNKDTDTSIIEIEGSPL